MRTVYLMLAALVVVVLGIAWDPGGSLTGESVAKADNRATIGTQPGHRVRTESSIADHPDAGRLFSDDRTRQLVHSGASTWHPVKISEAHALTAISGGGMSLVAPDGQIIRLRYERHYEHANGNWTWVGRQEGASPGTESVVTFGERAVFGLIRHGNSDLRLTTEAGSTWLVETDSDGFDADRVAASARDFLVPAGGLSKSGPLGILDPMRVATAGTGVELVAAPPASLAPAWTATTVDIVMGYTSGFAARLGGQSQAQTRLTFLVDLTNQAYTRSGLNAQIRLVRTLQLDYPDATSNDAALMALTGVYCEPDPNGSVYVPDWRLGCDAVPRPAALQPLADARETYGADLMVMVRKFEEPENASCGAAWMLGGEQTPINVGSSEYGVTVLSDSSGDMFPDNAHTCPELHLAHELGHNMGQQHDVFTARETDDTNGDGNTLDPEEYGAHADSFAHSTDGTASDLFTIMSTRRSGQTQFRVFANPSLTCGSSPCGILGQADNVRSMTETMAAVAAFRATQVEFWDVSGDYWAFDAIKRLANADVTQGCGTAPPMYCPDTPVTRDQMAVFLLRGMHGGDHVPPAVVTSRFADVPDGFWALSWIEQLAQEGITAGCGTSPLVYCPAASVTRDQMAVFLLRAKYGASYVPPAATGVFADVPVSYWAAPWIEKLAADGITNGCATMPLSYCPAGEVTRDQMAVFLVRTFGL